MIAKSRILVADDEPDCLEILKAGLEFRNYDVSCASNGQEALDKIQAELPDLIILDVMMPRVNGLEVCRRLKADYKTNNIPVLILTARGEIEDRVEGLAEGADDYLSKPFDMRELVARVETLLRRTRHHLDANPLTGLPGNLVLQSRIEQAIASGDKFAALYVDLDNFKAYNDRYGHFSGDAVIRATAALITAAVKDAGDDTDFVAHIGGDDFMVVTTPVKAESICESLIKKFDGLIPNYYNAEDRERGFIQSFDRRGNMQQFPIMSISIGIVTNELRTLDHFGQVSQIAAELKKFAKQNEGSNWVKDRRRDAVATGSAQPAAFEIGPHHDRPHTQVTPSPDVEPAAES